MTLRSQFQRFDRTPPYFEDLRTLYAMPILDWAVIFKPQFWLFFVAPPAIAYSFYHFLLIAMFVAGFTVLFVYLGGRELDAFLMALVLYFSAYAQYWWNGAANFLFPFFPWIVLALLWDIGFALRLLLFFWLLVCGLLTYFYPPNAIALGFVALVLWATVRPKLLEWRSLLSIALTAAGAGATVLFYLREPIARLADTVYPGQRVSGGGGVIFNWWLTQLFPTSLMNDHVPLIAGSNICELSTLGSIYVLAVLFFVPWRELIMHSTREEWRRWMWLGGGLLATQAWMTIYMPPWMGYALLWHLVPPGRMVLGGGLLLLVVAFLLGQARPPVHRFRLLVFCLDTRAGVVCVQASTRNWTDRSISRLGVHSTGGGCCDVAGGEDFVADPNQCNLTRFGRHFRRNFLRDVQSNSINESNFSKAPHTIHRGTRPASAN